MTAYQSNIFGIALLSFSEAAFLTLLNSVTVEGKHLLLLIFEMLVVSSCAFVYNRYQPVLWSIVFGWYKKKK